MNFSKTILAAAVSLVPAMGMAQSLLSPTSITVQRYDAIPNFSGDSGIFCCATHVHRSGGEADYYHIRMVFDVAFSDAVDRVSINSSDILLMLPGAEEGLRAIGHFDHMPVYEPGATSIYARRPRDFPAETEQAFLDAVWVVPEGVTSATMQIGDPEDGNVLNVPLDLDVGVTSVLRPAATLSMAVSGVGVTDMLTLEERFNGQDVPGTIRPTGPGRLMQVDLTLTPAMSTDTDAQAGENQFFFYSDWIGVTGPDGLPLMPVGYETGRSYRVHWSTSISWEDQPRGSDFTLYFLGRAEPGVYRVYYLSDKVAEFRIE